MSTFDRPLPASLAILNELANNLHWSWNHGGDDLWRLINPEVWESTHNPVSVLQLTSDAHLEQLAQDADFLQQLNKLIQARHRYLDGPTWYSQRYPDNPMRGVAYFSMEFGLCDALPLYAGGLGILAGDHLKTASDMGVPLVGIGLLYQQGYFRQSLAADGWQQETYLYNDPGSLPLQPLKAEDGSWLHVDTSFLCRQVRFRVWQAKVGRIHLYLLDSNDPRNRPSDRGITSTLYGGSTELRLVQEIALGICGWRLIEALGLNIDVCHLNEGHAAFATLERARAYAERHRTDFWHALWATRSGNVFTTHTPVEAGFDRYPTALLRRYISEYAQHLGISMESFISLGRARPDDARELFNMAYLALRTCGRSNGVSQLHGAVSRRIFQPLFPRWPTREVPVGHITNGIHVPTWDSPQADALWTDLFGQERWRGAANSMESRHFTQPSDKQIWQMAGSGRAQLVDYARKKLAEQFRHETAPEHCELDMSQALDPNILTLGFARRFAEYKRPDLLLHDPDRLARLLSDERYPVQLLVAGKAHPADSTGKRALQAWHRFVQRPDVARHVVLIEDYDMTLAQHLVQGVDVWLNVPRRPWEASGTSGMKVLANGGLNLSSLDGWWAEAYAPELGWALGDGQEHSAADDWQDAEQLYQLLENEVIPEFYRRDNAGLPKAWVDRIRASMSQLSLRFSSNRMLEEYLDQLYLPAAANFQRRQKNNGQLALELQQWHDHLTRHWHEVHVENLIKDEQRGRLAVTVYLGSVQSSQVAVQIFADASADWPALSQTLSEYEPLEGATHAYRYIGPIPDQRPFHHFTARVISAHPEALVPIESGLIAWQKRS